MSEQKIKIKGGVKKSIISQKIYRKDDKTPQNKKKKAKYRIIWIIIILSATFLLTRFFGYKIEKIKFPFIELSKEKGEYTDMKKNDEKQRIEIKGNVTDSTINQIIIKGSEAKEILGDIKKQFSELDQRMQNFKEINQIVLNRELKEISKYYPSGYKQEGFMLGPTDMSKKLKKIFIFMNRNFGKQITGKQFKQIDRNIVKILEDEPYFAYGWFYRGMLYAFIKRDEKLGDEFYRISQKFFKIADYQLNLLINKYPGNPFLILYNAMNLSFLAKGKESILFLREALKIDPDIFKKHHLLGIISFWKHIDQSFVQEWESGFKLYYDK